MTDLGRCRRSDSIRARFAGNNERGKRLSVLRYRFLGSFRPFFEMVGGLSVFFTMGLGVKVTTF